MRYSAVALSTILLLGFLTPLKIDTFGLLSSAEILAVMLAPLALIIGFTPRIRRNFWIVTVLIVLWAGGALLSDYFNQTSFDNVVRGLARPLVLWATFTVFCCVFSHAPRAVWYFLPAYALGSVVDAIFFDTKNYFFYLYGIFPVLWSLVAAVGCVYWNRARWLSVLLFGLLIVVSLSTGGRAISGVLTLTLATLLYLALTGAHVMRPLTSIRRLATLLGLLLVAGLAIVTTYEWAASSGLLGERQKKKYEAEIDYFGNLPIFFRGRIHFLIGLEAALEKPIIGHGTWASDPEYTWRVLNRHAVNPEMITAMVRVDLPIPTHSILLSHWVESGVLALGFPLFLGYCLVRYWMICARFAPWITPMIVFLSAMFSWHLLFSPWGVEKRVFASLLLAFFPVMLALENRYRPRKRRKTVARKIVPVPQEAVPLASSPEDAGWQHRLSR